jgi:thiamine biosynthesis lipoprotein
MGTEIEVFVDDAPGALANLQAVRLHFAVVEAALSRFIPASEVCRDNAAGGGPVSALLAEVMATALDLQDRTGGLCDPASLTDLLAAGYDRTFDLIPTNLPNPRGVPTRSPSSTESTRSFRRRAELSASHIHLHGGAQLDLGGIAKGWTVDHALELLDGAALVNAGGDLRARGEPCDGDGWHIGVQDPFALNRDAFTIRVRDCAVATSSIVRRAWMRNGEARHHIIDPRTGEPAHSDLVAATVVAPDTATAEAFAKAAIIVGSAAGPDLLARENLSAALALSDGRWVTVGQMTEFVCG